MAGHLGCGWSGAEQDEAQAGREETKEKGISTSKIIEVEVWALHTRRDGQCIDHDLRYRNVSPVSERAEAVGGLTSRVFHHGF